MRTPHWQNPLRISGRSLKEESTWIWDFGPEPEEEILDESERSRRFSETQWFMAGANPDELKDVTAPDYVSDAESKYRRDSSIPEEERQKFTLRKQDGEVRQETGQVEWRIGGGGTA